MKNVICRLIAFAFIFIMVDAIHINHRSSNNLSDKMEQKFVGTLAFKLFDLVTLGAFEKKPHPKETEEEKYHNKTSAE